MDPTAGHHVFGSAVRRLVRIRWSAAAIEGAASRRGGDAARAPLMVLDDVLQQREATWTLSTR